MRDPAAILNRAGIKASFEKKLERGSTAIYALRQ